MKPQTRNSKPETPNSKLDKAMDMCSRREYCRKEVFEKAVAWGCTPAEASQLVDVLVEQNFIDERRYTEAFVKDKLRLNKWGRVKIGYMLRRQNIDKSLITEVFSEIDETEYRQIFVAALLKKYTSIRRKDNILEVKAILFRFVTSRGLEPDIADEEISKFIIHNS